MGELTQEEKGKLWDELSDQWKIVKGKAKGDIVSARKRINKIQTLLELEVTNFEDKQGDEKPAKKFTVEEAKAKFTKKQLEIINDAEDLALAVRFIIANSTPKKAPELKTNQAGIGQIVNLSSNILENFLKKILESKHEGFFK